MLFSTIKLQHLSAQDILNPYKNKMYFLCLAQHNIMPLEFYILENHPLTIERCAACLVCFDI